MMQFIEIGEAKKTQSMHFKTESNDHRAYLKNKNEEKNSSMACSVKKNHRQFEMNRYIQEAKN